MQFDHQSIDSLPRMISRLKDSLNFYRFDMFTIIVLTVLGLLQGEVTVSSGLHAQKWAGYL